MGFCFWLPIITDDISDEDCESGDWGERDSGEYRRWASAFVTRHPAARAWRHRLLQVAQQRARLTRRASRLRARARLRAAARLRAPARLRARAPYARAGTARDARVTPLPYAPVGLLRWL